MQIKEIVQEGFWDNFGAARAARAAGKPMTASDAGMPWLNPVAHFFNKKKELQGKAGSEVDADRAITAFAKSATDNWSRHLSKYEQDNNNKPLNQSDFALLLAKYITTISGVRYDAAMVQQKITDQNLTKVHNFIREVLLQKQADQEQRAKQQRATDLAQSSQLDQLTGIPYGTKIRAKVRATVNGRSMLTYRDFEMQRTGYFWDPVEAKVVDPLNPTSKPLYDALIEKYKKSFVPTA